MTDDARPESRTDLSSETLALLANRVSVRRFTDDAVTDAHVDAILRAAIRAPTSSNLQAYSVIVVRDADVKRRIAEITDGQRHVAECPVYLQFCADLTRMEAALKRHGRDLEDNNLECGLVASIDASLVGMAAYMAADSLGIKGVMIGAVRNDPVEIGRLLGLPRRVYPVFGMCLGWPAKDYRQKPRLDLGATVHREKYDQSRSEAELDDYDARLADHYRSLKRPTTADSWTRMVAEKFAEPRRDMLRAQLKEMGFDFR